VHLNPAPECGGAAFAGVRQGEYMNPDYPEGLWALLGGGVVALLIWLLLTAGAVAFSIWVMYTIIWRAVRRGLREYHHPRPTRSSRDLEQRVRGPRDW